MKKKLWLLTAIVMMIIISLYGCGKDNQNKDVNETGTDEVHVVSLAPSVTEILFAIGADDMIVGRTDYCNYPEVASSIESIGTYSSPNMELIIEKNPKYVIASDFIDENIKNQLEAVGTTVYVVNASSVEEIENEIIKIGDMLDLSDNAKKVVDDMKREAEQVAQVRDAATVTKTVFFDLGSFYSVGNDTFLGNVLDDIGVTNIAADSGESWPQLSVEAIVEANPDIYISSYTSADDLRNTSGLNTLDCMQESNLIILDSELADCLQRPGPRIVEAELKLARLLYE